MDNPSVCFYPLSGGDTGAALRFACRLAEKAWQLGHQVHLLARSEAQMRQLDDLLWQFRPDSFVPHACLPDTDEAADVRVTLGTSDQLPTRRNVLINLTESVWDKHQEFDDIREVVPADDQARNLGRQRYRVYQDRGYALETRPIKLN